MFCSDASIKEYLIPQVKFLQRPKYLDTQAATPQDIITEFMKLVEADVYAVCHCTSPFVLASHIDDCVKAVLSKEYDSAFTAEKIQRLLWNSRNEPLNFAADSIPRTQDLEPIYNEVSAAYVFTRETFERLHRRVGLKPYLSIVSGVECVDIDYPEDFEIANALYMKIIKKEEYEAR